MAISERKYRKLLEKAQADAIRFRQERDAAVGWLRSVGRLTAEAKVELACRNGVAGLAVPPDTARLDAVERECADVELTCAGIWRVTGVEDYEGDSLREAIDRMMAAVGPPEKCRSALDASPIAHKRKG